MYLVVDSDSPSLFFFLLLLVLFGPIDEDDSTEDERLVDGTDEAASSSLLMRAENGDVPRSIWWAGLGVGDEDEDDDEAACWSSSESNDSLLEENPEESDDVDSRRLATALSVSRCGTCWAGATADRSTSWLTTAEVMLLSKSGGDVSQKWKDNLSLLLLR